MDRQTLESLVYQNFSTYEIAHQLACSQTNVRHWLKKYGLTTKKAVKLSASCLGCGSELGKNETKFCSNRCQKDHEWREWKAKYLAGELVVYAKLTSRRIRRLLIETFGERCSICGWCEVHPVTGKVPLELDHIDGDHSNNAWGNVRLLCPNHHALTPTYRALNTGKGRVWRRKRLE